MEEKNFSRKMPIVHKKIEQSENIVLKDFVDIFRLSIDPTQVHESSLPGNHQEYSCVLTEPFVDSVNKVRNFKVRPDDVWIIGFIKTGTTWLHNIVNRFIRSGDDNELIATKLENQFFDKDFRDGRGSEAVEFFDNLPSPRIFKTHLPAFLLPAEIWTVKPKIIYITRNPKDAVLSAYHMLRNSVFQFNGTLDEYCTAVMNGQTFYSPFFDHVRGYLQIQHLDHIMFTVYEDLSSNQYAVIKRINAFLGCSYTDDQLHEVVENVSFRKMRNEFPAQLAPEDRNSMPDPGYRFCRKGKAGTFREEMSDELVRKFDEWTEKELAGTNFKYPL